MIAKKRAGRPKKSKLTKKEEKIFDGKAETKKEPDLKSIDMYPDRIPIYGGDEYIEADPTKLTKNGEDWDPRKAGYEVRLMDPKTIENMGFRGYIPVRKETGIRFKNHPLMAQSFDGDAGNAVYLHPKDNQHNNEELEILSGGRSNYVKLNSMILCITELENAERRRKLALEISNGSLKKDLQEADKQAQDELGKNKIYGKFTLGENASRSDIDNKTKTVRKIWSVPSQIK